MILLNKTDLVSAEELARVERRIRAINPHAVIHRTERCAIPLDRVLDRGAFDLDRILSLDPDFLEADDHDHDHDHDHHDHDHHDHDHGHDDHDHHHHDNEVKSIALAGGDLEPKRFFDWINEITERRGGDILRLKGILSFKGDDERYVVQGVHMIVEGDHQRPWKAGETRTSKLVFIGRHLDPAEFRAGFEACRA